jgi:ATP-dependent helicase/nuclease subunit B
VSLVVGSESLARQWEAYLAARQPADGAVWASPPLIGLERWAAELWNEAGADASAPNLHASALTSRQSGCLWREVVRASQAGSALISPNGAARLAERAFGRLRHWRIDPATLEADATQTELHAFLLWCSEYQARLEARHWIDRAGIVPALCAQAPAFAVRPVTLLDRPDLTPAQDALLTRLRRDGWTVEETEAPSQSPEARAIVCDDPNAEIDAAMAWARTHLERDTNARLAVVVPDLADRAGGVKNAFEEAFGVPAELEHVWLERADPPTIEPAIGAAVSALELLTPTATFVELGRWLRSPFFGTEDVAARARCAELEARLRPDLRARIRFLDAFGTAGLAAELREACPDRAHGLERAVRGLDGARTPTDWVNTWQRALLELDWLAAPMGAPAATRDTWEGALAAVSELTPIVGSVPHERALEELRGALSERSAQAHIPLTGVCVLESVDSVGPGYDGVWVTGCTDRRWPEPVSMNPLLPLKLQVVHAMPGATPALTLAAARRSFDRLMGLSPEIVFSWPREIADQAASPSSLLRGLKTENGPESARPAVARISIEEAEDPAPALESPVIDGGVHTLALQAACPIRAFCQTRLGTRPLERIEPGLSTRLQGKIVHRAIELLMQTLGEAGRFDALALEEAVPRQVYRALAESFGPAQARLQMLFRMEQARVERLVKAFIEREAEREPFVVRGVEIPVEIPIQSWSVSGRIDRLDGLPGQRLAILDYKTRPGFKAADWLHPRLLDCQLPLYAVGLGARVAALVVVELDEERIEYRGFGEGISSRVRPLPAGRSWAEQIALWRERAGALLAEFAAGDVRVFAQDSSLAQGPYAPLTRVYELLGEAEAWSEP